MDVFGLLKVYGSLAGIAGVAYAVIRQMFAFAWRLAKVEEQGERHAVAITKLEAPLNTMARAITRIETRLGMDEAGE
ncbi:MAG TPA: hypothetical protein VFW98_08300 [Gemmatimonadaceae bacterium]|nr:hypothetical protein [Gemmatimonadaceae bacterium]